MRHPLDRPVWSALTTRQAPLSLGDARALRFAPDYAAFGAAADEEPASQAALGALVPPDGELWLVETHPPPPPPGTVVIKNALCWQMIAETVTPGEPGFEVTPLTDADGPQVLALATLTQPGPFFARTHQLGDFVGVKQGGRLVAMAGERMRPTGFTEVSGVCTHPDHRSRGYGGGLMRIVAERILARGETPFLHVYATNVGAIALYQSLGFDLRSEITAAVVTRL